MKPFSQPTAPQPPAARPSVPQPPAAPRPPRVGLMGGGAFGAFAARALSSSREVLVHDPRPGFAAQAQALGLAAAAMREAAACDIVVFAVPVAALAKAVRDAAPHMRPGALALDVGSVKCLPARILREGLPETANIVATHPLFGPQSAREGLAGLKIALCDIRGGLAGRVGAALRREFGLRPFLTTPEAHDREVALSQGLMHLIARAFADPTLADLKLTTRSFDLLRQATAMTRDDPQPTYEAIMRWNPYAAAARAAFLDRARALHEAAAPVQAVAACDCNCADRSDALVSGRPQV